LGTPRPGTLNDRTSADLRKNRTVRRPDDIPYSAGGTDFVFLAGSWVSNLADRSARGLRAGPNVEAEIGPLLWPVIGGQHR
jgi:hypothetical protein